MKARLLIGSMAALAAGISGYSTLIAPRRLQVVRLRVASPGLPPEWRGVRIAHLSDFHVGATGTSNALLLRSKRIALAFRPNIVALTGDYFDNGKATGDDAPWSGWPDDVAVFGVLGNHDFRGDDDAPAQTVRSLVDGGVTVLRNEAVGICLRGRRAWIAGVDDPFTWRADERAAFHDVPDDDDALLYLAHCPSIDGGYPSGRARLVLSGHTHGGQVRLLPSGKIPGVHFLRRARGTPPRRDPPVYIGSHWLRGSVVVVSTGLGVSRLPIRFFTRPQVLLIELAEAVADGLDCDSGSRYVTAIPR
jgi:predicted MPP superfamily phosphohydrolase